MKVPVNKFILMTLTSLIIASCGQPSGINDIDGNQISESGWFSHNNNSTPLIHQTQMTVNNKTTLLVDGTQIFPEIYNIIDQAQRKIYVTTYLFGESIGHKIAEKLIARQKEGVEIQFVAEETMGSFPALTEPAKKEFKFMAQNGILVKAFPVDLLPKGPTFFANQKLINHAKMVVVDDSVAIIGGMNFKDSEAINHDYMVKIEGPAAAELTKINDITWQKSRPMNMKAPEIINLPVRAEPQQPSEPVGASNVEIGETGFTVQSIPELLIKHFNNAKSSIEIEMLMVDHQEIVQALVAAKKRGVDVKIILDEVDVGKFNKILSKLPLEGMANFGAVMSLLDGGVNVRWYVPKVKDQMLHAKAALIDNQTFIVGSANYTYHALTRNHEVSVAVTDPNVSTEFSSIFARDWASNSKVAELKSSQRFLGKLYQKFGSFIYKNKSEAQVKSEIPEISKAVDDVIMEKQQAVFRDLSAVDVD
jgi:cardiolipin synthase